MRFQYATSTHRRVSVNVPKQTFQRVYASRLFAVVEEGALKVRDWKMLEQITYIYIYRAHLFVQCVIACSIALATKKKISVFCVRWLDLLSRWLAIPLAPAFSTPAIYSRIFHGRILHPCILVPHIPIPHFSVARSRSRLGLHGFHCSSPIPTRSPHASCPPPPYCSEAQSHPPPYRRKKFFHSVKVSTFDIYRLYV